MTQKIRAINPQIIVTGEVDKPYYQIQYYDTADNKWHIGYGSYFYSYVREWMEECFDIVKDRNFHINNGLWKPDGEDRRCSNCGAIVEEDEWFNHNWYFCYHCGANMNNALDI